MTIEYKAVVAGTPGNRDGMTEQLTEAAKDGWRFVPGSAAMTFSGGPQHFVWSVLMERVVQQPEAPSIEAHAQLEKLSHDLADDYAKLSEDHSRLVRHAAGEIDGLRTELAEADQTIRELKEQLEGKKLSHAMCVEKLRLTEARNTQLSGDLDRIQASLLRRDRGT